MPERLSPGKLAPGKLSTRDAMIGAAAVLIRQRGVAASGMQDIVAQAAAPRGSIYHHFPGGKDELIIAALQAVTAAVTRAIRTAASKAVTIDDFVTGAAALFRGNPEGAGWTEGCPVAAATIEGDSQSQLVRTAIADSFDEWRREIAAGLRRYLASDDADQQAMAILAAIEGALIVSRGMRSPAPFDATIALLRRGLKAPA